MSEWNDAVDVFNGISNHATGMYSWSTTKGYSFSGVVEDSYNFLVSYNNEYDSWSNTLFSHGATVTKSTSITFNYKRFKTLLSGRDNAFGLWDRLLDATYTTTTYGFKALEPAAEDASSRGFMLQNETDGFNRIWNSSFSEKTEYAALVTPRGLITFNAGKNGGDLFGGLTSSWKGNKCSVVFQGKSYQVLGSVHVHWDKTCDATPTPYDPTTGSGDNGAAYYTRKCKIPLFVLGWDKTIYETGYTKLAYQSGFRQNHFNVNSLLSGELSLINILQLNQ